MKVIVAGASGLIGRELRRVLESGGHEVVALVRGGGDGIRWDPSAGSLDPAALEGADAVVSLSGERIRAGRWTRGHRRAVWQSRVDSTQLIAEALASLPAPPPVFLCASAIGVYGSRGDEELPEESAPGSGFLADLCRAWEAATAPAATAGVRVVNLRTGLVLAGGGGLLKAFMPPGPFVAGRLGDGQQWMSWISIDDEVGAIVHLLSADVHGAVNLVAPNPVRNRAFAATVSEVLGKPALPPVPAFAIRLLFGAEAADQTALASQRGVPARLEASGFEFTHTALEPALRAVLSRP